jgi:hypothetical protein
MATFKDKTGQDWTVSLDPVIADEIKQDHGIELTNLANDPLLKLRTEPAVLYAVILVICREQMEERNLTREQFLKRLPMPPDLILTGIEEGITSFFPSGRHSHVREVLASYANMGQKTDELTTAKMRSMMDNPQTMKLLSAKADREIETAIKSLTDSPVGT